MQKIIYYKTSNNIKFSWTSLPPILDTPLS